METKFTKGNWNQSCATVTCGNAVIADCESEFIADKDELFANARLIAVAPKMYKFLDDLANGRGTDYQIELLLAEARGEANE